MTRGDCEARIRAAGPFPSQIYSIDVCYQILAIVFKFYYNQIPQSLTPEDIQWRSFVTLISQICREPLLCSCFSRRFCHASFSGLKAGNWELEPLYCKNSLICTPHTERFFQTTDFDFSPTWTAFNDTYWLNLRVICPAFENRRFVSVGVFPFFSHTSESLCHVLLIYFEVPCEFVFVIYLSVLQQRVYPLKVTRNLYQTWFAYTWL